MKHAFHELVSPVAVAVLYLMAVAILGQPELAAQSDRSARRSDTAELYEVPDLAGTWAVVERESTGNCAGHSDDRGLPRRGCRLPVDQLQLTARAFAWLDFHDEPIEGKFYCVPESMPGLLVRSDPVRIDQRAGRLIMEYQFSSHNNITRVVWMDGRSHPAPGEVPPSYYGYSIGRYEGNELVVDTWNFTFDPNGIDSQAQIPSSWLKRLTERYSRIGTDRLRMVLTVEDPLFLKEPYTETLELAQTDRELEWTHCDFEQSKLPLMFLPPKYPDE